MPAGAIPFPFGDCRICKDKATGVHYGVATCEGCKGFFKRSTTKSEKYKCFFGGQCILSPKNRNRCKACRYQKCLQLGMSMEAVKMGRIPKVDKERALEAHHRMQVVQESEAPDGLHPELHDRHGHQAIDGVIPSHHQDLPYNHHPVLPNAVQAAHHRVQPTQNSTPPYPMSHYQPNPRQWAPPMSSSSLTSQHSPLYQLQSHCSSYHNGLLSDGQASLGHHSVERNGSNGRQGSQFMSSAQPHLPPDQFPQTYSSHSPELPTSAGVCQNYPKSARFSETIQHRHGGPFDNEDQMTKPNDWPNPNHPIPLNHQAIKQEIPEACVPQDFDAVPSVPLQRQMPLMPAPEQRMCEIERIQSPAMSVKSNGGSRPQSRSHFSSDVIQEMLQQVIQKDKPQLPGSGKPQLEMLLQQVVYMLGNNVKSSLLKSAQESNSDVIDLTGIIPKKEMVDDMMSCQMLAKEKDNPMNLKRKSTDAPSDGDCLPPKAKRSPMLVNEDMDPIKKLNLVLGNMFSASHDKSSRIHALMDQLVQTLETDSSNSDVQHVSSTTQPIDAGVDLSLAPASSKDGTTHSKGSLLQDRDSDENGSHDGDGSSSPDLSCSKLNKTQGSKEDSLVMIQKTLEKLKKLDEEYNEDVRRSLKLMNDEFAEKRAPHPLNGLAKASESEAMELWKSLFLNIPNTNKRVLGLCNNIPGFMSVSSDDRAVLMEQAYFDIWLLTSSPLFINGDSYMRLPCGAYYSRWWMNHFLPDEMVTAMFRFCDELNVLKLSHLELVILCAVRLTDPDRTGLKEIDDVRLINNHYWDVLAHELQNNHGASSGRMLINIFRILPSLLPIHKLQLQITGNFCPDNLPEKAYGLIIPPNREAKDNAKPSEISSIQSPNQPLSTLEQISSSSEEKSEKEKDSDEKAKDSVETAVIKEEIIDEFPTNVDIFLDKDIGNAFICLSDDEKPNDGCLL